jgi:hypothetical protein
LSNKQNLPNSSGNTNNLTAEANYLNQLYNTKPRSSTGDVSYLSTTSGINYTTSGTLWQGQGQEGLLLVLQNALSQYLITAIDFNSKLDNSNYIQTIPYAVATGSSNTYSVTPSPAPTSYVDGMAVSVKINSTCTGASTLNINGLGSISIKDSLGNAIVSGGLKANIIYTFRYESTSLSFIVQGKGGGGNATASQMLVGSNATTDSGFTQGTMPNNGALNNSLPINGSYTIPSGYTTGGSVTQNIPTKSSATITPGTTNQTISALQYLLGDQTILGDSNLVPVNIPLGKSMFGVNGTASLMPTTGLTAGGNTLASAYVSSSITITKLSGTVTLGGLCTDTSTWYSGGFMANYSVTVTKNGVNVGSMSTQFMANQVNAGPSAQWLSNLNVTIAPGDTLAFSRALTLFISVGNTTIGTI